MSVLSRPAVAALAAKAMQRAVARVRPPHDRFPEFPGRTEVLTVPTAAGPARAVLYRPDATGGTVPLHVNFHGGGFVMGLTELDDPLCRLIAGTAEVAVLNVDYVLAPQHPFPAPPRQAFDVVRWAAEHGDRHGWDGSRLSVGGQSAGGSLAAAVARQAFEQGGPRIALQALHYPSLDLVTPFRDKGSPLPKPMLRPWMAEVFNASYLRDPRWADDRLHSPAAPGDTTDLTGIAPALVVTAEHDVLRGEGERYAERLREAGALVRHHVVSGADHGYDVQDPDRARAGYDLIARHVRRALHAD
ncbi:alpha/beta hydrolase [Saccharopolyspora sp. 6M]|uniref:alpha/beta hydrolase n=1 Tax=Saccharopolyspora sp. 6M TaxID=2877237 RepID=UPI001CD3ECC7|nr:alpha/beta hydrolase [Saccharopolyspora sp. 6M]MCA1226372.1 alpha/beta hydrolase [Saccharopolyspora sp. 6M]